MRSTEKLPYWRTPAAPLFGADDGTRVPKASRVSGLPVNGECVKWRAENRGEFVHAARKAVCGPDLVIRSPPYDGRLCPFQGSVHGSVNRLRHATGPFWLTGIDLRRPPMGRAGALTLPAPLRYSLRFVDRASGRVRPMPQARLGLGHPGDRPLAAPVREHA